MLGNIFPKRGEGSSPLFEFRLKNRNTAIIIEDSKIQDFASGFTKLNMVANPTPEGNTSLVLETSAPPCLPAPSRLSVQSQLRVHPPLPDDTDRERDRPNQLESLATSLPPA